jgi:DNA polymerase elongation subunit (family B)
MVGSVDINSLYPSVLRSLNMSPETLVGHIRPIMTDAMILERRRSGLKSAQLWEGIFNTVEFDKVHEQTDDILEVDFVDGSFLKMTAKEVYELVYNPNSKMTLTANGTIFRTDTQGVIPSLLERWYSERKILQAREKVYGHVSDEHETILKFFDNDEVKAKEFETALNAYLPNAKETSEDVGKMLKLMGAGDIESVGDLMKTHNFILENGSINAVDRTYSQTMVVFWNQRQQARKILLNSLYGALLNEVMKFYDKRIGQSVTLTGRNIVRHMNASVNEEFTGEYDYKGKAIVYADTDSVAADSIVETNIGKMTIEDLFNKSEIKWSGTDGKEYAVDNRISTLSYEPYDNTISYKPINYIYRHKVSKPKWKITDADGREVVVTDDHSIMIERGADTYEIKPSELKPGDIIITIDQK